METRLPVADPAPYPPVKVQAADAACAKTMLENAGGITSEMTAVAQYLYNSTVLREECPKAAEYFHKIAVVEMRHIGTFFQLACLLGADPRLWSCSGNQTIYWDPAWAFYSRDLPVILNRSASNEAKTIGEYRRQAASLPDPYIKAILERFILDEEKHLLIFRRLYQEYCRGGRRPSETRE